MPACVSLSSPTITLTCTDDQDFNIVVTGYHFPSLTNSKTINVIFTKPNDPPTVDMTPPGINIEHNEDVNYSVDLTTIFSDLDLNQTLTYYVTGVPDYLVSSLIGADLSLERNPDDTQVSHIQAYDVPIIANFSW